MLPEATFLEFCESCYLPKRDNCRMWDIDSSPAFIVLPHLLIILFGGMLLNTMSCYVVVCVNFSLCSENTPHRLKCCSHVSGSVCNPVKRWLCQCRMKIEL